MCIRSSTTRKPYVDGQIHTNGLENFWSLLKRAIKGTYVSVEPFHLFRYLDEQTFRFNTRKMSDAQRFVNVGESIIGKRLIFDSLTGHDLP
jgi:ISXO2-like transposase domain